MQLGKNLTLPMFCQITSTNLVIPSALQMGWTLSPFFLHVVSKTARGVTESYAHERVGTLPEHSLEVSTISELLDLKNASMWGGNGCNIFLLQ